MSTTSQLSRLLQPILTRTAGGVVGLVDDLLRACRQYELQLDWRADRCRVRSFNGAWEELTDVSLRAAVFRAVLARVAVLCNQRAPNSVSPYGGRGELTTGENPPSAFTVTFTNTAAEQKLELLPVPAAPAAHQHTRQGTRRPCSRCGGTGKTSFSTVNPSCADNPSEHVHDCVTCGGTGYLE
jgi:hypothetical protein